MKILGIIMIVLFGMSCIGCCMRGTYLAAALAALLVVVGIRLVRKKK